MAEITECPQCQRKLNVQESQLGQDVQCPVCGATFAAEAIRPTRPAPPPPAVERDSLQADDDELPRRSPREYDDRDYDDRPRGYRRDRYDDYRGHRPHRGATVLTLGILGLVFSCCAPAGWIMGGIALGMGNADLREMNTGRMDDSGRGATSAGRVCGLIAVIVSSLAAFGWCMVNMGRGIR
jgi:hypothetical protein